MQIINTNYPSHNQSFGRLITDKNARRILNKRLNTPGKYLYFESLENSQIKSNFDIKLSAIGKRLVATIEKKQYRSILYCKKENIFNAFFQTNPLKFVEKICIKASKLDKAEKRNTHASSH